MTRSTRSTPARLAAALFADTYGAAPAVGASAPGRVNLIGEHLDYNGGPVLPVAVERRTAVMAAPAAGWHFVSSTHGPAVSRDVDAPMLHEWSDYLVGVVRELRAVGAAPDGAQVAVASDLPIGAGLSSSAALTVAAAHALARLAGHRLDAARLADIAYRAEHDQVGVRCGRMDQTIAAHGERGHALYFDTVSGERRPLPLAERFWIVESGRSHRLTGGELNARRHECETALARLRERRPALRHLADLPLDALPEAERLLAPEDPALVRRVRHVVTETARTRAAAEALEARDLARVGALLVEGHRSLREDYESTVPEADLVVESAMRHGAWGARLTGAGWGGALVLLAPEAEARRILAAVRRDFRARFGRAPVAWASRAAAGVRGERGALSDRRPATNDVTDGGRP